MTDRRFWLVALIGFTLVGRVDAQDAPPAEQETEIQPVTTVNPDVPVDQLRIMVKPLTKAELEAEADAWFNLLRAKARQVAAVRLGVKKTNEAISADDNQAAEASLSEAVAVRETAEARAEETEQKPDADAEKAKAERLAKREAALARKAAKKKAEGGE